MKVQYHLKKLFGFAKRIIDSGHERSVKAKRNILSSLIIRAVNIGINLSLVPVAINYINPIKYGIWVTVSSIILWFGLFDVGLTSGFRNKFSEALAINDYKLAKTYVSTTYSLLTIIFLAVALLLITINPFLNWTRLLNAPPELKNELSAVIIVVVVSFCLKFILQIINTILSAIQKPALNDLINTVSQVIILSLILGLIGYTSNSLLMLSSVYSIVPIIVLLIITIVFFQKKYKDIRPSLKTIDFKYTSQLMNLGVKFFILSLSTVVLFNTNNIIITHLFGPEKVTIYNVTFRYFNIINMIFSIIISPFWSAHTEAWIKKDISWIKSVTKKLIIVWAIICMAGVVLLALDDFLIGLWVGKDIPVYFGLSIVTYLYFCFFSYQTIFINFLNGISIIRLQLIVITVSALINVPLALILGKEFGMIGIVLTQVILFTASSIIFTYQYKKIITGGTNGIWYR